MSRLLLAFIALFFSFNVFSQFKDSTGEFKFSGYLDAYYGRFSDDSIPLNGFQKYTPVSPRNDAFGLNIVQLSAQYTAQKIRAIATIHFGDLPTIGWSPVYNAVQEANVGFKLGGKFWIDGGFFKTHIGTELFLPKDNITSSIAMATLVEPWFQSGVKLSYQPNESFLFCLHLLNGYNTYVETNKKKSVGITLYYAKGEKWNIGYYNLFGDEFAENTSISHYRILNNLVFNYQFNAKLKALVGLDYIGQQNSTITDNTNMIVVDSTKYSSMYSAIITLRYQLKPKWGVYCRYDMFHDGDGFLTGRVIDATHKTTGLLENGFTLGAELKPTSNTYVRIEGRDLMMDADQKVFLTNGSPTNVRYDFTINAGVWF